MLQDEMRFQALKAEFTPGSSKQLTAPRAAA
jgi:hypothetical protein